MRCDCNMFLHLAISVSHHLQFLTGNALGIYSYLSGHIGVLSPLAAANSSNTVPLCRTAQLRQNDKICDLESQEKEVVQFAVYVYCICICQYLVKVGYIFVWFELNLYKSGLYLSYVTMLFHEVFHSSALTWLHINRLIGSHIFGKSMCSWVKCDPFFPMRIKGYSTHTIPPNSSPASRITKTRAYIIKELQWNY